MLKKISIRSVGFMLAAFWIFTSTGAQENQPTQTVADTVQQEERELISPSEITNRLPESSSQLRDLKSSVISDENMDLLGSEIDSILLRFDDFQDNTAAADTGRRDRRILEGNFYNWNQWKSRLNLVKIRMNNEVVQLEEQKKTLDELTQIWELSNENFTLEKVPADVREMVQEFISLAREANSSVNQKTRTLLSFLNRITQAEILIDEKLNSIQEELDIVSTSMFFERNPWLPERLLNKEDGEKFIGHVPSNIKYNLTPSWDYITKHATSLLVLFLIFLLLTFFLFINKKNLKIPDKGFDEMSIFRIQYIVNRPILTSLYITLSSTFLILPELPQSFLQLLYLTFLIPIVFLLPGLFRNRLNRPILFLVVMVFILDVADLLLYPFGVDKIIEIGIAVVLIIGLSDIIRKKRLMGLFERKSVERFAKLFSILATIMLAVSILCNISGYYLPGEFLVEGITWSFYSIALFMVGYVILISVLYAVIHSKLLQNTRVLKKYDIQVTQWFFNLAFLGSIIFWIYIVFYIFRVHEFLVDLVVSIWNLGFEVGTFNFSLGNVIIFFLTLWIAVLLSRIIQTVLEEDVLPSFKMSKGLPKTISQIVKYGLLTIGVLIAFAAAGIELSSLSILLGALGVGIGFGLQDVMNNFISGLILLFERPVRIGDAVKVGELEGVVVRIGIRSSIIQTFDRAEVIVPNGQLISKEVVNWTLSNTLRRLEIEVGVEYGSDIGKVMKILKECAESNEKVLDEPAPYVWFKGYNAYSIDFRLLFFYPQFDGGLTVRSEVARAILEAFKKNGLSIPFPRHDTYIKEHQLNEPKPGPEKKK